MSSTNTTDIPAVSHEGEDQVSRPSTAANVANSANSTPSNLSAYEVSEADLNTFSYPKSRSKKLSAEEKAAKAAKAEAEKQTLLTTGKAKKLQGVSHGVILNPRPQLTAAERQANMDAYNARAARRAQNEANRLAYEARQAAREKREQAKARREAGQQAHEQREARRSALRQGQAPPAQASLMAFVRQ